MKLDLFNAYLKDLSDRMEQIAQFRPHCRECGDEIYGNSYNGRCGSCAQQLAREERYFLEKDENQNQD